MSNNKMLIDATHPEETRVVVLRNGRVEEFDFESAARKLLRGNIYLAKVTRVEPSLQAAFVEYGGNRHGFLAFNEIHPDYYQIPMADRQALLDEEAAAEAAEEAAVDAHAEALARRRASAPEEEDTFEVIEPHEGGDPPHEDGDDDGEDAPHRTMAETMPREDRVQAEPEGDDGSGLAANENTMDTAPPAEEVGGEAAAPASEESTATELETNAAPVEVERVEQVSTGEDALEELPSRPRRRPRSYKIQEVIKRRQVILVQVVKEERGNKGAALTTYLSLAGRYTVLMPNTARGGGISRKITNPQDRKRLKAIAAELEVPEGMGLIIRTAGAARTKQEIKRDFEYLLRLWESVRDLTLQSQAPSLVYEEGNLIKRSIRDLYNKDVDEVIVAGGEAHREAKDFMRMLMPSHAKNVTLYQEPEPLFTRFQIERQLNAMFSPYVTLRSGGYLVINQTEALVAIDVNSGKATREFSIEETAHHTNLEAADEIARQLKLRDLAGLIVIDFIDMEEKRNNRAVERRLKEALRFDRARIQVGRISHFGLLEMSRQRLRTGVLEGSTSQCPHCQGTGIIRSTESVALAVLRGLEDSIMAGTRAPLIATTTPSVALYILNNKRPFINDMEGRLGLPIMVTGSDKLAGANFTIEKGAAPAQPQRRVERNVVNMESGFEGEDEGGEYEAREQPSGDRDIYAQGDREAERGGSEEGGSRRRRRRRRGGRRGDREENGSRFADEARGGQESFGADDEAPGAYEHAVEDVHEHDDHEPHAPDHEQRGEQQGQEGERMRERGGRSRRRGRRGGRRGRDRNGHGERAGEAPAQGGGDEPYAGDEQPYYEPGAADMPGHVEAIADFPNLPADGNEVLPAKEVHHSQAERSPTKEAHHVAAEELPAKEAPSAAVATEEPRAARRRASSSEPRLERIVVGQPNGGEPVAEDASASNAPARKGWWQRKLGGE
ncbi:MAG: ribonuclease E/G [Hyphomicrobium sp.]|uniref:Rne/Rng family ribonuclease n=1 Tax=Hyphomicrobium sp. TaxID=82 RepID=UPI00132C3E3F|nr:ribonuclease E/G [Hyphomicrobium sp.]KAB2940657.1 MAG: ribonuclease E/G [Hyphomicrobium sp.]MBZ0211019.1 ribonuclease E/G [Hyphomicrobium sp.]